MRTRMYYVDDSGAGETGYAVFSWITCDITAWRTGLAAWLALRRRFFVDYQIPPSYELHASVFVNGRGRPSLNAAWNVHKANRVEAAKLALSAIADCPELTVGTVYRRFHRPRWLGEARTDLYARLVDRLDHQLAERGEFGLIFMDGDGSDRNTAEAHRLLKLDDRHVIEDPSFRDSRRSQWVQMADFVAYTAYQNLLRDPTRRFLWSWYDHYLRNSDASGGPIEL